MTSASFSPLGTLLVFIASSYAIFKNGATISEQIFNIYTGISPLAVVLFSSSLLISCIISVVDIVTNANLFSILNFSLIFMTLG